MAPVWWKESVCYQVWPASFLDANGDGLGDIPGIISKLDYLNSLGVNTIWLSPMYASPQVDMGYDISDYNAIYPPFGTMADVDRLIEGVHERSMRIVLDLVINHTSDQHSWFKESRKSQDNPRSDWYIWKDSKMVDGKQYPPNNWGSNFGGSAWNYVAERNQWYLHLWAKEQPDLNWENREARRAIYESAIRFWLRKGVDGFRVDTANNYSKDQKFLDMPVEEHGDEYPKPIKYVFNGPRIHEFWQEMHREVFDEYKEVMLVGEMPGTSVDEILKYIRGASELSMLFDFELYNIGRAPKSPWHEPRSWKLPEFKDRLLKTQGLIDHTGDAWVSAWLESHDSPRSISRYGNDSPAYRQKATKLLAMFSSTISGTVFIFQGQEIGMTNIPQDWSPDDLRDIRSKNFLRDIEEKYPGDEKMRQRAWKVVCTMARDNARTPVQWDGTKKAGFTSGEPWMRINENNKSINVAEQIIDDSSPLAFWRKMIRLRKEHAKIFTHGTFEVHDHDNLSTLTFTKKAADGSTALVVLNMSDKEAEFSLLSPFKEVKTVKLLVSSGKTSGKLAPWEGRVVEAQNINMSIPVPTVTQDDLNNFHAQHFSAQPAPAIRSYPHQEIQEDDNLGYYADGVKRTLTDDQIKMFRHSEIETLLRERRRRAEQSNPDGDYGAPPVRNDQVEESIVKQSWLRPNEKHASKKRKVSKQREQRKDGGGDGAHVKQGHVVQTDAEKRTHRRIARELDEMNAQNVELDY